MNINGVSSIDPYPKLNYIQSLGSLDGGQSGAGIYTSSGWFTSGSEDNFTNEFFDGSSCNKKIIIDTGELTDIPWNSPGNFGDTQYLFFSLENINGETYFNDSANVSYTLTVTNAENLYAVAYSYFINSSNQLELSNAGIVITYGLDSNGDGDAYNRYRNYSIPSYQSIGDGGDRRTARTGFLIYLLAVDYTNPYSGRILIENMHIRPSGGDFCIGSDVPYFKFKSGSLAPTADNGGEGTQSDPFEFELEATGNGGESSWHYIQVGLQYASPAGTSAGSSIRAKVENTSGYTNLPSDSSHIDIQQSNGEDLTFVTNQEISRGDQGPAAADYFNAYLANGTGNNPRTLLRVKLTNPDGSSSTTYRATIKLALIANVVPYF